MLTQSKLKEVFDYNKETGIFTWKCPNNPKFKIGYVAGNHDTYGYVRIGLNKKSYKAHRLAWLYVYGYWPENEIDHIDGVRDNNRITNLRDVTRNVNQQNQRYARRDNKLGVLGVCWHKASNSWTANILINGKATHLGCFETINIARITYLDAKRKFHTGCTI